MKSDLFADVIRTQFSDQPLGERGIHKSIGSLHHRLGTESTVEITYIGEFYVDSLERNLYVSKTVSSHHLCFQAIVGSSINIGGSKSIDSHPRPLEEGPYELLILF